MVTDTLFKQFQMCNYVIKANLGDITQEESMIQPVPAGNCINWVLRHIVAYRCQLLKGLGEKAFWDEGDYKMYERHEAPLTRAEDAKPITEIWAGLEETLARIEQAFSKLTPAKLAEEAPSSRKISPAEPTKQR